jgi:integrase
MRLLTRCPSCRLFLKHDAKSCKCGIKIPNVRLYYAEYYLYGKRKREKLGHDYKTAMISLVKIETSILEGRYEIKKQTNHTFGSLCNWYFDLEESKTKRTYRNIRLCLERLSLTFGDHPINETLRDDFLVYIKERSKTRKPATINRDISISRSMFETALKYNKIPMNPFRALGALREDNERIIQLTDQDIGRLISECDESIRDAVKFASLHVLRWYEIYGLQWRDIDIRNAWITIPSQIAKGGKFRGCPIDPKFMSSLITNPNRFKGHRVFTYIPKSTFGDKFRIARDKAGLKDVRFHDLRHYAANRLKDQGYKVEDIMKWAGWSSMAMFHRYTLSDFKAVN